MFVHVCMCVEFVNVLVICVWWGLGLRCLCVVVGVGSGGGVWLQLCLLRGGVACVIGSDGDVG